ncbi:MAG TPA: basic secretory protein-like protein, partial [Verrucomicrobiae bacterium]|nr:basic secretory protein-like protein [Verrucomicrobiae bacterium]
MSVVRGIDIAQAPEMDVLGRVARAVADAEYPRILKLLGGDTNGVPPQFDLVFKHNLPVPGLTSGTTIYLSADYFEKYPDYGCFVHEMVHVAQHYAPQAPSYWVEGIADYARYALGFTNRSSYPHCTAEFPHYTSGYWCTGAFLLFLDAQYGREAIRALNTAMRQGKYSEDLFLKATGKNLAALWTEFQKTPAYAPAAALGVAGAENSPKQFWFDYKGEPTPGRRDWTRQDTTWTETYPNGVASRYQITGRATVDGTSGTLAVKTGGDEQKTLTDNGGAFQVFIPDVGSARMVLL